MDAEGELQKQNKPIQNLKVLFLADSTIQRPSTLVSGPLHSVDEYRLEGKKGGGSSWKVIPSSVEGSAGPPSMNCTHVVKATPISFEPLTQS